MEEKIISDSLNYKMNDRREPEEDTSPGIEIDVFSACSSYDTINDSHIHPR